MRNRASSHMSVASGVLDGNVMRMSQSRVGIVDIQTLLDTTNLEFNSQSKCVFIVRYLVAQGYIIHMLKKVCFWVLKLKNGIE